jgi:hypothetical protein
MLVTQAVLDDARVKHYDSRRGHDDCDTKRHIHPALGALSMVSIWTRSDSETEEAVGGSAARPVDW